MADRFVAPDGKPTNAGTIEAPWALAAVLDDRAGKYAQPGDTVHLRGGTYRYPDRSNAATGFLLALNGQAGAPIVVRNYGRERATIDGGIRTRPQHLSRHYWIMGLEVKVQEYEDGQRTTQQAGSNPLDIPIGGGFDFMDGSDVKLINNVVHDCACGIAFWGKVERGEVYGNLVYQSGWTGPDRGHGPGIYSQNEPDSDRVYAENIFCGGLSQLNVQIYGSGSSFVDRVRYERNISFLSPRFPRTGAVSIGSQNRASNNDNVVADNINYKSGLRILTWDKGGLRNRISGNVVWQSKLEIDASLVAPVIENNLVWPVYTPAYLGDRTLVPPTGPRVIVYPNQYDADRANVAVLNFTGLPSVQIPVGTFLAAGDSYELRAADDFFGAPVLSGTYDGSGAISLPMTGEFLAGVLLADRDPCAATRRELEQAREVQARLSSLIIEAEDRAERLALEVSEVRRALQIANEQHALNTSERLELAQRVESLDNQVSALQSQQALMQSDLRDIGVTTDRWR